MAKALPLGYTIRHKQSDLSRHNSWPNFVVTVTPSLTRPPLKIFMTVNPSGERWTYSLDLAQALIEKGHQVALATLGGPLTTKQCREIEQVPGLAVFENYGKLSNSTNSWPNTYSIGQWLLQLEQQVQPDVIHLNGYAYSDLPWQAPKLVVGHFCMLSWWQAVKGEHIPNAWETYRQQVKRGLTAADLVVAPTQSMLAALEYHYNPLPHGRVIPSGRNPNLFSTDKKQAFILTSSRVWDDAKSIAVLESAARQLSWPVYLAAQDKYFSSTLTLLQYINFLGMPTSEEMASWFAQAAIYVLPSRYEPFGLSILEAAMSKCALVLSDLPSLREVWGDAALYVSPDDPVELEIALTLLIIDSDFRNIMAKRAYTRAKKYTSAHMAANYLSVYQELINLPHLVIAGSDPF